MASKELPSATRSIRFHKTGGPEVLQLDETAVANLGPNDILIKSEWAGVNFIDTYFRSGLYNVPLPFTLGSEAAGIAVAVGENVQDIKVGDKVAAYINGSYSEIVLAPRARVAKLPSAVDTRTAAAIMLQALTAWGLLIESYPVQKGDWVLVHAAAGGVGVFLCQLASYLGAKVIGTVSTEEKAEFAKANGADEVILYTKEDFAERVNEITGGKGVAGIYDGVGKTTWEDDFKCIARKGTIVSFGNASGAVPAFAPLKLSAKNVKVTRPTLVNTVGTQEEMDKYSADIFDLAAKGVIKPHVHGEYAFSADGLRQAHADLTQRKTTGKLLVKIL
ncbi:unnamed protein product [Parajaminaea phylloscopi]